MYELADFIKHNGLIQPILVRPNNDSQGPNDNYPVHTESVDGFSIGTRRRRVFQRLLDIPGYNVAALVEESSKSANHIHARLSLLELIPTVAEASTQERLTASHASLLARLPQEAQAIAYEQC